MKLDLIIPVYGNKIGLYRSLFSLGVDNRDYIDVTIVDDCSNDDYTSIIDFFAQFVPIRIIKTPQNVGPGMARQWGIDHTCNDYIMFLDCGDYYTSPDHIPMIYDLVQSNPELNLFCFAHMYRGENVGVHHNRLHGKIYKRHFLKTHNIQFNPNGSYANEDVGFNMAVKMILYQYERDLKQNFIYYDDTPVIMWDVRDPGSLTRKNNNEFYFNMQNPAIAINGGWALDIAKREHVDVEFRAYQAYQIMCDSYFKFLSTTTVREEFTEQALYGAALFYWNYFKEYAGFDVPALMKIYYDTVVEYLSDWNDPIRAKFTQLDFIKFLDLLENTKEILDKSFDFYKKI